MEQQQHQLLTVMQGIVTRRQEERRLEKEERYQKHLEHQAEQMSLLVQAVATGVAQGPLGGGVSQGTDQRTAAQVQAGTRHHDQRALAHWQTGVHNISEQVHPSQVQPQPTSGAANSLTKGAADGKSAQSSKGPAQQDITAAPSAGGAEQPKSASSSGAGDSAVGESKIQPSADTNWDKLSLQQLVEIEAVELDLKKTLDFSSQKTAEELEKEKQKVQAQLSRQLQRSSNRAGAMPRWRHVAKGNPNPPEHLVLKGKSLLTAFCRHLEAAFYMMRLKQQRDKELRDVEEPSTSKVLLALTEASKSFFAKAIRVPMMSLITTTDLTLDIRPEIFRYGPLGALTRKDKSTLNQRMLRLRIHVQGIVDRIVHLDRVEHGLDIGVITFLTTLMAEKVWWPSHYLFSSELETLDISPPCTMHLPEAWIDRSSHDETQQNAAEERRFRKMAKRLVVGMLLHRMLLTLLIHPENGALPKPRTRLAQKNVRIVASVVYELIFRLVPDIPKASLESFVNLGQSRTPINVIGAEAMRLPHVHVPHLHIPHIRWRRKKHKESAGGVRADGNKKPKRDAKGGDNSGDAGSPKNNVAGPKKKATKKEKKGNKKKSATKGMAESKGDATKRKTAEAGRKRQMAEDAHPLGHIVTEGRFEVRLIVEGKSQGFREKFIVLTDDSLCVFADKAHKVSEGRFYLRNISSISPIEETANPLDYTFLHHETNVGKKTLTGEEVTHDTEIGIMFRDNFHRDWWLSAIKRLRRLVHPVYNQVHITLSDEDLASHHVPFSYFQEGMAQLDDAWMDKQAERLGTWADEVVNAVVERMTPTGAALQDERSLSFASMRTPRN